MNRTKKVESARSDSPHEEQETAAEIVLAKFQLGYYSRVVAAPGSDPHVFSKLRTAIKALAVCIRVDQFVDLQNAVERLAGMQPATVPDVDDQLQWFLDVLNEGVAVVSTSFHASLIQLADNAIATLTSYDPWYEAGVRLGELQVEVANDPANVCDGDWLIECVQRLPQEVVCLLPPALACDSDKQAFARGSGHLRELVQHLETGISKAAIATIPPPAGEFRISTKPARGRHRNTTSVKGQMECQESAAITSQRAGDVERYVSLEEASEMMPGRPSPTSIWRWYSKGIKGVRLETILVAGRRFTSREKIDRFIAATTAAADGAPTPTRSPTKRERAIAAAECELGVEVAEFKWNGRAARPISQ